MSIGQNTSLVNVQSPCFCSQNTYLSAVDKDSLDAARTLCDLRSKGMNLKRKPVTEDQKEYKKIYDRLNQRKYRGTLGPIAEQCCNGHDCHSFHNGTVRNGIPFVKESNHVTNPSRGF